MTAVLSRKAIWALLSLAMLGCSSTIHLDDQFFAFGTLIEVTVFDTEPETVQAALDGVRNDLAFMHQTWHAWQPSALSQVNAAIPTGTWITLDPTLPPLLEQAKRLSQQSQGLFNPAIGQLISLWGFHRDDGAKPPPPPASTIAEYIAQAPSMDDLIIEGTRLRATNANVRLDLGAITKGYAVDRMIEHLKALGIDSALINAGGDLRAYSGPGKRTWTIGIRHPRKATVLASLLIKADESVVTSGDYERYFEYQGQRYHHILDPRTGYPPRELISVTVVHPIAATADAAATALFVAGLAQWRDIAKRLGITQAMLVDQAGRVHLTGEMAGRIRFEVDPKPEVLIYD